MVSTGEAKLDELPLEVIERILSHLSPEETCTTARLVCRRFQDAAYNVIRNEFLAVKPLIEDQLEKAKSDLEQILVTIDTFQNEMILVAKFTFLQVLHSEYQILSTIFFQNDSNSHSAVIFKAVRNIKEFYDLLNISNHPNQHNWSVNISDVIDKLRKLNSAVCDDYFWNNWNISQNPFGPLFMKLICCAICSQYQISVCHESNPQYCNSKCHLHGVQEIPDLSCTLSPLPSGSRNIERCTRILALYVCDSIRWSNVFYSLRLRWTCMDRALILGRSSIESWPLLATNKFYLNSDRQVIAETETELRNNAKRLCRILKKDGETMTSHPWLGIKSDFRLWSPISDVPAEMFKQGEHSEYRQLPEGTQTFRPYLFKLVLKIKIKTRRLGNTDGVEETVVWFEETPERYMYTQSKKNFN